MNRSNLKNIREIELVVNEMRDVEKVRVTVFRGTSWYIDHVVEFNPKDMLLKSGKLAAIVRKKIVNQFDEGPTKSATVMPILGCDMLARRW